MRIAEIREIARERVGKLLDMAHENFLKDPEIARRYVTIALNIAKRVNLRLSFQDKLRICKKCFTPIIPGVTGRVRIRPEHGSKLVITCMECGNIRRIPIPKRRSL